MNKNKRYTFCAGLMAVAGLVASTSCSDTWDEHYDANGSGVTYDGTLLSDLKSKGDLSDFVKILEATGYDQVLNGDQVYTVWAPKNGTYNADSIIEEINNGNKSDVVTRFVENHISRYNYSVKDAEQNITMLNEKVLTMSEKSSSATIGENTIDSYNESCSNGVLHEISGAVTYRANIYEELELNNRKYLEAHPEENTDSFLSLFKFLDAYENDSLDENKSVSNGYDTDGNKVFIDSVMIRNNNALNNLNALVYEEDSSFWAIVPSPKAYKERHDEIGKFLNYNSNEEQADTFKTYYSHYLAVRDLFYNMNRNTHSTDSLVSTTYSSNNWEHHVYYKPLQADGILGKYNSSVGCSNGTVYYMDEWPMSIYDSFFHKVVVRATPFSIEDNTAYTKLCSYSSRSLSYTQVYEDSTSEVLYDGTVLDITPNSSSVNPSISFNIPSTFSGKYDIYVVTVPLHFYTGLVTDETKPYKFRVNLFEKNESNKLYNAAGNAITAAVQFKNTDGTRNFVSDPSKVDSIYVGTYECNHCYYGGNIEAGILLQLNTNVTSSEYRNNLYSKRMLIDRILFVPHVDSEDE